MMEAKGVSVVLSALDCLMMNKQIEYIEHERVKHDVARLGYFLVYKWNLHDVQAMNIFAAATLMSRQ
jgi:hypothetical protein